SPISFAKDGVFFVAIDKLKKPEAESLARAGDHSLNVFNNVAVWSITSLKGGSGTSSSASRGWGAGRGGGGGHGGSDPASESLMNQCGPVLKPLISKYDLVLNLRSSTDPKFDDLLSAHILDVCMADRCDTRDSGIQSHHGAQERRDDVVDDDSTVVISEDEIMGEADGRRGVRMEGDEMGEGMTYEDFAEFIHIASNIDVKLSEECAILLRCYFSALRKLHGNVVQQAKDSMFVTIE
ncbi:hypothetical protein HK102_010025, partial [Quaeritorhiza haematococci]